MLIHDLVQKEDKIITVSDARNFFKGCIPGWQTFAETHGFIWKDVVKHGLLASQLLSTNDAMAQQLVEFVYSKGEK